MESQLSETTQTSIGTETLWISELKLSQQWMFDTLEKVLEETVGGQYVKELLNSRSWRRLVQVYITLNQSEEILIKDFRPQTEGGVNSGNPMENVELDGSRLPDATTTKSRDWILIILAMMVVIATYMSTLRYASIGNELPESHKRPFLLTCNSSLFVASLTVVISLLNKFKLKPWPQVAFSMLFGCYSLLVLKISPEEFLPLLVLSIPLLLLAAAGKLCAFAR